MADTPDPYIKTSQLIGSIHEAVESMLTLIERGRAATMSSQEAIRAAGRKIAANPFRSYVEAPPRDRE